MTPPSPQKKQSAWPLFHIFLTHSLSIPPLKGRPKLWFCLVQSQGNLKYQWITLPFSCTVKRKSVYKFPINQSQTSSDCIHQFVKLWFKLRWIEFQKFSSKLLARFLPLEMFILVRGCESQFYKTSQELRMLSPSLSIQRSQCNCPYCCSQLSDF